MLSVQVLFIPFLALKRNLAKDNLFLALAYCCILFTLTNVFVFFSNQWNDDINILIAYENLAQVDKRAILNKLSF